MVPFHSLPCTQQESVYPKTTGVEITQRKSNKEHKVTNNLPILILQRSEMNYCVRCLHCKSAKKYSNVGW